VAWFWRGARTACLSPLAIVLWSSYVGFGGLLHDVGFPLGAGVFATLAIWALPAQLLLVGGFVAGTATLAIAFAVGLSSMRMLPLVVSILPYLRGHSRIGTQLLAAHFVAVSGWVEGMRHLPALPAAVRMPFFFGLGSTFVGGSAVASIIGFYLAGSLPRPLALGLLFLTPISFLLALMRNARDRVDHLSLAFGLALAPVMALYAGTLDLLWTGILGGSAAFLVHRLKRRRT
jgi:predicted branched-subunit amino acid permease